MLILIGVASMGVAAQEVPRQATRRTGDTPEILRATLAHPSRPDRARLRAARALVSSGDPAGLATLLGLIGDRTERSILRAAMVRAAAGSHDRERVLVSLEARLADPGEDAEVRAAAAAGLGVLGHAAARPALGVAAQDPAPPVRLGALHGLLLLPGTTVAERGVLLAAILRDREQPGAARAAAADGLGELGDRGATPALLDAVGEPPPPARPAPRNPIEGLATLVEVRAHVPAAAARALGRLRDPTAVPVLLGQVGSPDAELRVAVFEALAALRAVEAIPAARIALADPVGRVRRWAALLLRELGAREGLPELRAALGDSDPGVRLQAALALGAMRDTEARDRLEGALETERSSTVRQALTEALHGLR